MERSFLLSTSTEKAEEDIDDNERKETLSDSLFHYLLKYKNGSSRETINYLATVLVHLYGKLRNKNERSNQFHEGSDDRHASNHSF